MALSGSGQYDRALEQVKKAERLPPLVESEENLIRRISLQNLKGSLLNNLDRNQEAERVYRKALKMAADNQLDAPNTLGVLHNNLGTLLYQQGKLDAAIREYQQALDTMEAAPSVQRSILMINTAGLLTDRQRYPEAEKLFKAGLAILRERLGAQHVETLTAGISLAGLYLKMDKLSDAEKSIDQTLEQLSEALPDTHFITSYAQNIAAQIYCAGERAPEGMELAQRSLATRRELLPEGNWAIASGESVLGYCAMRLGKLDQAREWLQQALLSLESSRGKEHPITRLARQRLQQTEALLEK
jgi:tetratricopeptide (TPR) repeat protein